MRYRRLAGGSPGSRPRLGQPPPETPRQGKTALPTPWAPPPCPNPQSPHGTDTLNPPSSRQFDPGSSAAPDHRRRRRRGARPVHPGAVADLRIRPRVGRSRSSSSGGSICRPRAIRTSSMPAGRRGSRGGGASRSGASARRSTRCISSGTRTRPAFSGCSTRKTGRTRSRRCSGPRNNGCASKEYVASAALSACRSTRKPGS